MSIEQEDRDDRVRRRAYQLWEDAGMPYGAALEFWLMAEDMEVLEEAKRRDPLAESFPAERR